MTVQVSDTRFLLASLVSSLNDVPMVQRIQRGATPELNTSQMEVSAEIYSALQRVEAMCTGGQYEPSDNPLETDILGKLQELGQDVADPFWQVFRNIDRGWFIPLKPLTYCLIAHSHGQSFPVTTDLVDAGVFHVFDQQMVPRELTEEERDVLGPDRWEISEDYLEVLETLDCLVSVNPYIMLPAQLGELQPTPNPGLAFFYASASMLVEDLRSSFEFGMGTSYQSTLCAKLHPGATMYGTEIESSLTDFMRRILDEEVLGLEDVKDRTEVFSDDSLFYFREKGPFDFIPFAFTVPNDVNLESVAEQSLREGGVLLAPQQYEKDGALTQPHEGMFRLYRKSEGVIEMAEVLDCSFTPAVDYAGPYGA